MPMKFIAYHVKGLGELVQTEILEKVEAKILGRSEKYIVFATRESSIPELLELRTPDDVHLLLLQKDFEERPENDQVIQRFPVERLDEAESLLNSLRDSGEDFSLTVSKYMNDRIGKDGIEENLAEIISRETGRKFSENSGFDLRIHVEENRVLISCRLSKKPLYFRDYYQEGRKGSLKTSIAAALIEIAGPESGEKLVDNFCGAGTILCEAAARGLEISGGDIDREAVQVARKNLGEVDAESTSKVKRLNAASTDKPDNCFDITVSNFPWGKQVDINSVKLYSQAMEEYSRILKVEARLVVLGKHPELAEKYIRKNFPEHEVETFQLGFLGQKPSVTYAEKIS